jgi:hypothetical protein
MSDFAQWRRKGIVAGCLLLMFGGVSLCIAGLREKQWIYARSFHAGSIWTGSGMLVSMTAILLLLCGRGWWRGLLEIAASAEMYCWFSWLIFAVQMS